MLLRGDGLTQVAGVDWHLGVGTLSALRFDKCIFEHFICVHDVHGALDFVVDVVHELLVLERLVAT